jgi:opacity protein-like surface antigen
MVKKYLLAIAMLGTAAVGMAESAPVATGSAPVATSMASRAAFIKGLSAGINAGYQVNTARIGGNSVNFNSPAIGAHLDYNHLLSNPLFIGTGLDISYSFKSRKFQGKAMRKELSGAFTLRAGIVSGPVAFDVNGAILATGMKLQGGGESESDTRIGYAPGVFVTVALNPCTSIGAGYRYEIYARRKSDSIRPRINSHNFFAKLSYYLQK